MSKKKPIIGTKARLIIISLYLMCVRFYCKYILFLKGSQRSIALNKKIFDEVWYLEHNPDVQGYNGSLADHFFEHGLNEGRCARFFDSKGYYDLHKDLREARMDPWTHYKSFGQKEGRTARFLYVNGSIERCGNSNYDEWLNLYGGYSENAEDIKNIIKIKNMNIQFSIIISVVSEIFDKKRFSQIFMALKGQLYRDFECLVGCAGQSEFEAISEIIGTDKRFRIFKFSQGLNKYGIFNRLSQSAQYSHFIYLNKCDILNPSTLFWLANEINTNPEYELIYADEDSISSKGVRFDPRFKPDFNYELFLSHNYLGNLIVLRRELFQSLMGFDEALNANGIYDLILRAYEDNKSLNIRHIPRILNHAKDDNAGCIPDVSILEKHFSRIGRDVSILPVEEASGYNRVRYTLPQIVPKVSIIIPTRDRVDLLRQCISSVLSKTNYSEYELIIVDNGSVENETLNYFSDLKEIENVRIIHDDRPFNFSALNNVAVGYATGEIICLMNNDIEIITPDWIEEMLSFAIQEDVGCVGARLWYPDNTLQHGGVLVGYYGVAGHMHKFLRRGEASYQNRAVLHQALSAVTGAVLMVKKAIYDQVGGLDQTLAVAFNDVDFCLKVRNAGYRNVYTPYAEMYHHESASRGAEDSPAKKAREQKEILIIKSRYGDVLLNDPAYSPNLAIDSESLSFAFPPRVKKASDILSELQSSEQVQLSKGVIARVGGV